MPFLICDLAIALTAEHSDCMDRPYQSTAYVLRPWLLAMGIAEASFVVFLGFFASLRVCGVIDIGCMQVAEVITIVVGVIKSLVWIYMELALFAAVIVPHCSGGIFAYGVILTIIHGLVILAFCCVANCNC